MNFIIDVKVEKVGQRELPSALLYMIIAICKAKIFTANQFARPNLKKLLVFTNREIIF